MRLHFLTVCIGIFNNCYLRNISDDHERAALGDDVSEVEQRGPGLGLAGQHQQLRRVVLDVLAGARQAVRAQQCGLVHLSLRATAPVHIWKIFLN